MSLEDREKLRAKSRAHLMTHLPFCAWCLTCVANKSERKAQAKASKALKKRANYTGDDAEMITKLEDAVDAANKLSAETGVAATAATKRWKALKSARKVARGK